MENDDFVKWANENIIVLVAHQDKGHEPETEKSKDGEEKSVCPLYPGLTCEQHQNISSEVANAADGMPKPPPVEGVPASFFFTPGGEVKPVAGAEQQSAGKTQEIAEALQKGIGDHIPWKKWEKYQEAFANGDAATEKGDWKAAIKAYAVVDAGLKKAPQALADRLAEQVKLLSEKVSATWVETRDGDADLAAKHKVGKDLLTKLSQRLSSGHLPVRAEIEAWLKENKPAKP